MNTNLTAKGKVILSLILFIIVLMMVVAGYFAWNKHADTEARLQQAMIMNQQQVQDANVLQNELKLSKQNAQMLAQFAAQAQAGQVQPVTHFTVQAPSLPMATQQVAERINAKDPTLPPVALEKTDNTIVTPNVNKTPQAPYDVAVFKNNNYRNWEWSAGYGEHGGDRYIPVELQRNFSKDAAVSYEHHFGGKKKGWEATYTVKTDKLFFIF